MKTNPKNAPPRGATRGQMERLWQIMAMVQSESPVTAGKLAKAFEVSVRTIRRDIDFLRDRLGIDISYDTAARTYNVDSEFTHIPPLRMSEDDLLVMAFASQCIAQHAGTSIGSMMNESFERLFGLLTGSRQWQEFSRHVTFRFGKRVGAHESKEADLFRLLHRSIQNRQEIRFDYKAARKDSETRIVEPLLISMHEDRWYLYARDVEKNGLRLFNFARIQKAKQTRRTFEPSDTESLASMLRHSFGVVISADPPIDVVLDFDPWVTERLMESVWHPLQMIEERVDGGIRLTLPLNSLMEVRPWILSWGAAVKVVAPAELASVIAAEADKTRALYTSASDSCGKPLKS